MSEITIADKFKSFYSRILISQTVADNISYHYKRITKQLNGDFWDTDSDTAHSLLVGSYGRDTDIHVSDVDLLFILPYKDYERINAYNGNGQSALLQELRNSIRNTYSSTHISGDGQVIKLNFTSGIGFEILPCFLNKDGSYTYPDTNNGGEWETTNPKPEIQAIRTGNNLWNGNLKRLARMARAWKSAWNVPIKGLLLDTLSYNFLKDWAYRDHSFLYYDWMTRDFFEFLMSQDPKQDYWLAPGSNQYVWRVGNFEYKALRAHNIALEALDYEDKNMPNSANKKWREIYGSKF